MRFRLIRNRRLENGFKSGALRFLGCVYTNAVSNRHGYILSIEKVRGLEVKNTSTKTIYPFSQLLRHGRDMFSYQRSQIWRQLYLEAWQ